MGLAFKGAWSCQRNHVGSMEGTWMGLMTFSLSIRVEKKERARLKTVKFHARTGMIESNRVSADLGLSGHLELVTSEGKMSPNSSKSSSWGSSNNPKAKNCVT